MEFVKRGDDGRNLAVNEHCVITLMGRFNNETGEYNLIMVLANETSRGLQVQRWIDRFMGLLIYLGKASESQPSRV